MRSDRRSVLRSIDVTYKGEREYFHKNNVRRYVGSVANSENGDQSV